MAIQGVITLEDEEIGSFDLNDRGEMVFVLHKVSNQMEDILEFASENGMTVALTLQPDFNGYTPKHTQ